MKKIVLILLAIYSNVIYASFPVDNINNQIYNQSEVVSGPDIAGPLVFFTVIGLYLGSILWHLSKPKPKDVKKKKKFFRKLLLLIFIPIVLFIILLIVVFNNMTVGVSLDDFVDAVE